MITVTLYTKKACSLCKKALSDLKALRAKIPHNLALVDIETDPALKAAYGERVPVLQAGPYTLSAPFSRKQAQATLAAAHDRQEQLASDPGFQARKARSELLTPTDRLNSWWSQRYLVVLNLIIFLYVGLPFLAPMLMKAGYPQAARPIYGLYGAVCHQLGFRSWFLFGEQAMYPRATAGLQGVETFQAATGIDESDPRNLLAARDFIGNEELGYKVAFCQRDIAIYGAMLMFGLLFAVTGRRIRPLPWYLWLLIGIAPVALDGFSQLLSQFPGFSWWEYRESTPLLRTLTGALFGFTTAWFGFPLLEESIAETRVVVASKKARLAGKKKP
ncbi:MAG: DUF2085 domain-containing protein [Anaerolineales bacterium]